MKEDPYTPNQFIIYMGFVSFVAIMAATMYLPLLPEMMQDFATSRTTLKLSVPILFLGMGIGQIIVGPLSDIYGKRVMLLIFTGIFVFSSFAAAQVTDITSFLYIRFFQGVGTAAAPPIVRALMGENFSDKTFFKVAGSISFLFSIAPGISPFLGSFIGDAFQWPAIFYSLTGLAVISLIIATSTRYDTMPPQGTFKEIYGNLQRVLKNKKFLAYAMLNMIAFSELFIFSTLSVFLFRIDYGWSIQEFSWVGLSIAIGAGGGALLMRLLISYLSSQLLLMLGIFTMLASSLLLFMTGLVGKGTGIIVLIGVIIYFIGGGLVTSVSTARALMEAPKYKGAASSIIGVLAVSGICLGTSIASALQDDLFTIGLVLMAAPVIGGGINWLLEGTLKLK